MAKRVFILIGTNKGAFFLESDAERRSWKFHGPFCEAWPINHGIGEPSTGTIYCAGGNRWFGAGVWKTADFGSTWTRSSQGLAYDGTQEPVKSVWSLALGPEHLFAGVQPAGLFRSPDGGE